MKKTGRLTSFLAGMIVMALICVMILPAIAAGNFTDLKDVMVGGIKIVVDGKELHPTDVNGNSVEPMIYNGTTYLPVRAVAGALNKAVYWDGPNYTVYLGNMDGALSYPTIMLTDMTSISDKPRTTNDLTDNYGNRYGSAITNDYGYNGSAKGVTLEYLLNMKYSRFKATMYIPDGQTSDDESFLTILADGHTIYNSPVMTKTSSPVTIDVDVTGYNNISIQWSNNCGYSNISDLECCLADAGFYQ